MSPNIKLIKPKKLTKGDTIGVFTPSTPAYQANEELFQSGLSNLNKLGFAVKLGSLTAKRSSQGYRSGTAQDRAKEFMELILDQEVCALIATIGGANSNSMIPYLDFDKIRAARKIIGGYSDVTSLHLSILKYAGLKTLYSPAVMTWFGEFPDGVKESNDSFLQAVTDDSNMVRELLPFAKWSNHRRDWHNGDWKNIPRTWQENKGWKILNPGKVTSQIVVANLDTLRTALGTTYFPDLTNKILLIEEMHAPLSKEERILTQLRLSGVFDKITGLIYGKIEIPDQENAPFTIDDLLLECVGDRHYPIVSEFDCCHTLPMHTLGQGCEVTLDATSEHVKFTLNESFVEA